MSNAKYTVDQFLRSDPREGFHNRTVMPHGLYGKNYCIPLHAKKGVSAPQEIKGWEIDGYQEFLDSGDCIGLRLQGCHDWDVNPHLGGLELDDLSDRSVTAEYVREWFFSRSEISAAEAAISPFSIERLQSAWPDLFDDAPWLKSFLVFRENGSLETPIGFTKFSDWLPMSRNLKGVLRDDIEIKEITLRPKQYLSDSEEYRKLVEEGGYNLIFIRAPKGVGKTRAILEHRKYAIRAVHTRRSLASTFGKLAGIPSHLSMGKEEQKKTVSISTCFNSFINLRTPPEKFDFVCDEIVQGVDTMLLGGVGLDGFRRQIVNMFCSHLLWSDRSWFMDADLTPEIANMVVSLYINLYNLHKENHAHYGKPKPVFIDVRVKNPEPVQWDIYLAESKKIYSDYVLDKLASGKRLMVWVENKRAISELKSIIAEKFPELVVEGVTADEDKSDFIEEFKETPMAAIKKYAVDCLFHTTSIDCGVSLDEPWFSEHVLMQCTADGINAQMITQIGGRIRDTSTPRTIFLSNPPMSPDQSPEWSSDPEVIVLEEYRLASEVGTLLDTEMFAYHYPTGEYVFKEGAPISQFFKTAYALQFRRQRNPLMALTEQLIWDNAKYRILANPHKPFKNPSSAKEKKALIDKIAEMPILISQPEDLNHEDYELQLIKWRIQKDYGDKNSQDPEIVKYALTDKDDRKSKLRRAVLEPSKIKGIQERVREMSSAYDRRTRREAEILNALLLTHSEITSCFKGVSTGTVIPYSKVKPIEAKFQRIDFRRQLRLVDRKFPKDYEKVEWKHIQNFLERSLGIYFTPTGKGKGGGIEVSVKSNLDGDNILLM